MAQEVKTNLLGVFNGASMEGKVDPATICQVSSILVEGKGMEWDIKLEVIVGMDEIHLINPYLRMWWDKMVAEILQRSKEAVLLIIVLLL